MKLIQSMKNTQVKAWRKLLTKKEREKTGTYLVEGYHLVEEALKYKEEVLEIISSVAIPSTWDIKGVSITKITDEISKYISATETPQGIFAVCRKREVHLNTLSGKQFLLIDAVQDPGNIGTMVRTADAAGIDVVILGKGCVDLYNRKVIRSAQGSHFHIAIISGDLLFWIEKLQAEKVPIYGTALENGTVFKKVEPKKSFALIVGNEGEGVSDHLLQSTEKNLFIPIYGQSESLNVAIATGILLYHLQKGI